MLLDSLAGEYSTMGDIPLTFDTQSEGSARSQENFYQEESLETEEKISRMTDFDSYITALVGQWDKAHNSQDNDIFLELYAPQVHYYGQYWDSRKCVEDKMRLFRRYSVFRQYSVNLHGEELADGRIKVSFEKHVHYDGKDEVFPSYLVVEKQEQQLSFNGWRIVVESDEITDRNLERRKKSSNFRQATS